MKTNKQARKIMEALKEHPALLLSVSDLLAGPRRAYPWIEMLTGKNWCRWAPQGVIVAEVVKIGGHEFRWRTSVDRPKNGHAKDPGNARSAAEGALLTAGVKLLDPPSSSAHQWIQADTGNWCRFNSTKDRIATVIQLPDDTCLWTTDGHHGHQPTIWDGMLAADGQLRAEGYELEFPCLTPWLDTNQMSVRELPGYPRKMWMSAAPVLEGWEWRVCMPDGIVEHGVEASRTTAKWAADHMAQKAGYTIEGALPDKF